MGSSAFRKGKPEDHRWTRIAPSWLANRDQHQRNPRVLETSGVHFQSHGDDGAPTLRNTATDAGNGDDRQVKEEGRVIEGFEETKEHLFTSQSRVFVCALSPMSAMPTSVINKPMFTTLLMTAESGRDMKAPRSPDINCGTKPTMAKIIGPIMPIERSVSGTPPRSSMYFSTSSVRSSPSSHPAFQRFNQVRVLVTLV